MKRRRFNNDATVDDVLDQTKRQDCRGLNKFQHYLLSAHPEWLVSIVRGYNPREKKIWPDVLIPIQSTLHQGIHPTLYMARRAIVHKSIARIHFPAVIRSSCGDYNFFIIHRNPNGEHMERLVEDFKQAFEGDDFEATYILHRIQYTRRGNHVVYELLRDRLDGWPHEALLEEVLRDI